MWLLHAHVNVNGQSQFTFPLEQKKSYGVGRRAEKEILFLSKRVRLDEGRLEVGDWDPSNPKQPPEVIYHVAPKKSKDALIPKYTVIRPRADTNAADLDSYDASESNEAQVHLRESQGMGIRFDVEGGEVPGWFTLEWKDVCILYDELKNDEAKMDTLRRFCIAYTFAFDPSQPPTATLSDIFRPTTNLSYTVCYGLPIVKTLYLEVLLDKLAGSWKRTIDSQDSFSLPDMEGLYPNEYEAKMPQYRRNMVAWLPDKGRKELFKGWSILSLNPNSRQYAAEKKWMVAMGIHWSDVDLSAIWLDSPQGLVDAASQWIKEVDEQYGRDHAFIAHFTTTRVTFNSAGVDFDGVVGSAAASLGVPVVSGKVCWMSVGLNSVEKCIKALTEAEPTTQAAVRIDAASTSTSTTRKSRSPEKAVPSAHVSPAKATRSSGRDEEPLKIPSTFPDEPTSTAAAAEAEAVAPPPTARRPLKRRAGKAAFDLFAVEEDTPSSADVSPHESQDKESGSMSMPPAAQPEDPASQGATQVSQLPPSTNPRSSRLKRRAGATASTFDIFDSTPAESAYGGTANGYDSIKATSETPAEIRALYEAEKRSTRLPPSRRTRAASRDSNGDVDMDADGASAPTTRRSTRAGSNRRSAPPEEVEPVSSQVTSAGGLDDLMEVDGEGDDDDFVQRTLKSVAAAKRTGRTQALQPTSSQLAMPPPQVPATRRRLVQSDDEEESEQVEPKRARTEKATKSSKVAAAVSKASGMDVDVEEEQEEIEPSNVPTQDTAFLQAISKSRSKKAIDEMDKEFNNLKIPKPATKGGAKGKNGIFDTAEQGQGQQGKWDGPDYSVLKDFTDEMRGNFIQVVKVDLFRKDGGRKESQESACSNGKPNFKKFKKKEVVRRNPLPLVLVGMGEEQAEMGEPYWPCPTGAASRRTQSSQAGSRGGHTQAFDAGDEDTLPLLPVQRRTQLAPVILEEDDDDDDDLGPTPLPNTGRRRGGATQTGASQASTAPTQAPTRGGARRTRGASVLSEDSTMSGPSAAAGAGAKGRSAAVKNGTSRTAKTTGSRRQPMLLEDSDEEEGVRFTPSAAGSSRTKGSTATTTGGRAAAAGATTSRSRRAATGSTTQSRLFDDDDDPPLSAVPSTAARRTGVLGTVPASASGSLNPNSRTARAKASAMGRGTSAGVVRKMLVDDDDDDDVIVTTAAKKRRLG